MDAISSACGGNDDLPLDDGPASRNRIVGLLCAYASESLLTTEKWAAACGIHQTDVRALAELGQAQRTGSAMTAGLLGSALGLSSPATSALIARLEAAGSIRRSRDPEDRRRVLVTASPDALRQAVAYFQPMGDAVTAALVGCSEQEMSVVASFLEGLVQQMRAIPSK